MIEEDFFGFSKRKQTINSKKKGNRNEQHVCKLLAQWTGEKFARTPSSGGLRRINNTNLTGDVYPDTVNLAFYFPFSVETKALKQIYMPPVLPKLSKVYTIFSQAYRDAFRGNLMPFVMIRQLNMPADEYYIVLDAKQGGQAMGLFINPISKGKCTFLDLQCDVDLMVFNFSDIVATVKYPNFINLLKRIKTD